MSLCLMMIANVVPHIGEELENLRETLTEVEPTFFHAVPRVWEKIASQILVNIDRSTPVKRAAYGLAMCARPAAWQCLCRAGTLALTRLGLFARPERWYSGPC